MTTVLVVVSKKHIEKFKDVYTNVLINFNQADFESWKKRTRANITHQNQNIEDEHQRDEIIEAEYLAELKDHERKMKLPGVVPGSEKFLNQEDPDGQQLWRVTVMKDTATNYIRVLKKAGFTG